MRWFVTKRWSVVVLAALAAPLLMAPPPTICPPCHLAIYDVTLDYTQPHAHRFMFDPQADPRDTWSGEAVLTVGSGSAVLAVEGAIDVSCGIDGALMRCELVALQTAEVVFHVSTRRDAVYDLELY